MWNTYNAADIADSNDATYCNCSDADDSEAQRWSLDDSPAALYYATSVAATMRGEDNISGGTPFEFKYIINGSTVCGSGPNGFPSPPQTYTYNASSAWSKAFIDASYIEMASSTIAKGKWVHFIKSYVTLTYYTVTEAAPTISDEIWNESKSYHAHFTRSKTEADQTIYIEYSYDGGAWTAGSNDTNTDSYTYTDGEAGHTIQFRARCLYASVYTDYTYSDEKTFVQPDAIEFITTTKDVYSTPATIEWDESDTYNPYYSVERSYEGGAFTVKYLNTSTSYNDNLNEGYGTYEYRVNVCSSNNRNNWSDWSTSIFITYISININGLSATKVNGPIKIFGKINGV